jgi:hypothetical protein
MSEVLPIEGILKSSRPDLFKNDLAVVFCHSNVSPKNQVFEVAIHAHPNEEWWRQCPAHRSLSRMDTGTVCEGASGLREEKDPVANRRVASGE